MSEADSVRKMWDSSRKEMTAASIHRLENKIKKLAEYPDMEDYDNLLGYISCLFDTRYIDLREESKWRNKAKSIMYKD